jgi:hypothetical protein
MILTGLAIILCLFGIAAVVEPSFPWAEFKASAAFPGIGEPVAVLYGYQLMFPVVAGVILATVSLLLVIDRILNRLLFWRAHIVSLAGIAVILLTGAPLAFESRYVYFPQSLDCVSISVLGTQVWFVHDNPTEECLRWANPTLASLPRGVESFGLLLIYKTPVYLIPILGCGLLLLGLLMMWAEGRKARLNAKSHSSA